MLVVIFTTTAAATADITISLFGIPDQLSYASFSELF